MKKISLVAMAVLFSAAAFAADERPQMPGGGMGNGGPGGGMFAQVFADMTDTQKTCLQAYDCAKEEIAKWQEMQAREPSDFQPGAGNPQGMAGNPPTDEEKAQREENRECMENAMEACGISMPEQPTGNNTQGNGKNVIQR